MIKIALLPHSRNLKENGYSIEEEGEIYDELLQDVIDNTRWYLDNLDYLSFFRVSWKNYSYTTPVLPRKYVRKQ